MTSLLNFIIAEFVIQEYNQALFKTNEDLKQVNKWLANELNQTDNLLQEKNEQLKIISNTKNIELDSIKVEKRTNNNIEEFVISNIKCEQI